MNTQIARLLFNTTIAFAIAMVLFVLQIPAPARAGGTVMNCADDTDFSTKLGGGGTVTFSCGTATITLSSTKTITQNTTIDAGNVITLSGGGVRQLFVVQSPAVLTLTNITIRDGNSGANDGGAVYVNNGGTLTITGSRFYSNTTSSTQGGGAITTYGALNISSSEFAYNKAGGGGALNTVFGGAVSVISNSNFHDNQTLSGSGGAIYIRDAAPMTLTQVTLSNNKALNQGGGILVAGAGSSLIISNSQILSNTALSAGGGIYSQGALNVISSTLSHNNADAKGGGIAVESTATISKTTVLSNTAQMGGGGIAALASASPQIINSNIRENYVYGDGGGIHSLATLVITGTNIQYNTTDGGFDTYGGGIYQENGGLRMFQSYALYNHAKYGGGINVVNSTATLQESGASFNTATVGDGGGLRSLNSSVLLNNGATNFNQATTVGGGISNQGTLTITSQAQVYYNFVSRNGGGIYQFAGSTTIISSTLGNNQACCLLGGGSYGMGGGIYNEGGTVALRNALVSSNIANGRGGGILNFDVLTVDRSTIVGNTSYGGDQVTQTYGGGGIYNFGNATVISSTIRGNSTTTLDGGGFYNGWYGNATLNNVTLSGNTAAQDGGGMKNNLGIATLTNVTFSGNTAQADGGGVYSDHGQTNLQHVTFSGNSAFNGGGIYNLTVYTTRTVSLQNTIIANSISGYNCVSDFPGSLNVVSQGYNLSDDGSFAAAGHCPSAFAGTDQSNTNAKLGALANNGGPTTGPNLEPMLTHLPLPGSPAIDLILPGTSGCNTTYKIDQRNVTRPQGTACDIGAVEYRVGDLIPRLYLPLILR